MTEPYVGQIQPYSINFPPKGWAQCDGQILPIAQNQALFSLLGTSYGGNGISTFALPDLRGRVPIGMGSGGGGVYSVGQNAGETNVTLNLQQLPAHSHFLTGATTDATVNNPAAGAILAKAALPGGTPDSYYGPMTTPQPLNSAAVGGYGQTGPHSNMQPYLAINWCIAQSGLFPSRS